MAKIDPEEHYNFASFDQAVYGIINTPGMWFFKINPKAPVAQKIADEVVFRRFQGEGVKFFLNRTSKTTSYFWCASFRKNQFKPFQLSFFLVVSYQDHVLSQMVKRWVSADPQFSAQRAREG